MVIYKCSLLVEDDDGVGVDTTVNRNCWNNRRKTLSKIKYKMWVSFAIYQHWYMVQVCCSGSLKSTSKVQSGTEWHTIHFQSLGVFYFFETFIWSQFRKGKHRIIVHWSLIYREFLKMANAELNRWIIWRCLIYTTKKSVCSCLIHNYTLRICLYHKNGYYSCPLADILSCMWIAEATFSLDVYFIFFSLHFYYIRPWQSKAMRLLLIINHYYIIIGVHCVEFLKSNKNKIHDDEFISNSKAFGMWYVFPTMIDCGTFYGCRSNTTVCWSSPSLSESMADGSGCSSCREWLPRVP